jgi:hypothetical protein
MGAVHIGVLAGRGLDRSLDIDSPAELRQQLIMAVARKPELNSQQAKTMKVSRSRSRGWRRRRVRSFSAEQ